MKNHSIQFRLCWTSFEIKLDAIEIISKHYVMGNNIGPNFIYFSTSSCISLGQIELIKYLQFSFTLASSNSAEAVDVALKAVAISKAVLQGAQETSIQQSSTAFFLPVKQ